MPKLVIDGVITLLSPLHVSAFGGPRRLGGAGNVLPTAQVPIASFSPVDDEAPADDDDAFAEEAAAQQSAYRRDYLPTLHANGLRGRVRRALLRRIETSLRERNQQLSIPAYYQVLNQATVGGLKDKQQAKSIEHYRAVQQNLFAGIFGIGTQWPSRLRVLPMMPIMEPTVEFGMIPDRFHGHMIPARAGYQITFVQHLVRRDELMEFADACAYELIDGGADAIAQWQAAEMANTAARRAEQAEGGVNEQDRTRKIGAANIMAHQCVIPGVPFHTRLELEDSCTEAQVGAIIASWMDVLEGNALGGNARYGYGRVTGAFDVTVGEHSYPQALTVHDGQLQGVEADLMPLIEAAEQAIDQLSAAEIEAVLVKRMAP